MTKKLQINRAIRAGVAIGALMAATVPAHADGEVRTGSLSRLGYALNWARGKTNLDGTTQDVSGGAGFQDQNSWENKVGGERVGTEYQHTKLFTVLENGYNTVKAGISATVELAVGTVSTPFLGKEGGAVFGATVAAGVVTLGETSADADMGKKVDVLGSTISDSLAAGGSEIMNQVTPGKGSKANEVMKVAAKTLVKVVLDSAGKDASDTIAGDLQTGAIDAVLAGAGVKGPVRDIAKGYLDGMIKDGKQHIPQAGGTGGAGSSMPSEAVDHGAGHSPEDMNHTPGTGWGGDHSQDEPGGPKDDVHGAGGSSKDPGQGTGDDKNSSGDDKNKSEDEAKDTTFAKVEDLQTPGSMIDYGGMSNPEDGSGNSGKLGAKLDQLGIHIGGWGRNDGDQSYGSQNSNSDTTNHAGNHAGGGGNLFEPDYDSYGGTGQTGAHQGSRGEGMGDGNASEGGSGVGDGGGIRTHQAIGSGYSGNTADATGWGGLDHLPMALDAPVTGQVGTTGLSVGVTGRSAVIAR